MQSNASFCEYILRTACNKIEMLRAKINDYQNYHISKSTLKDVTGIIQCVHENCITNLLDISINFNCILAYLCVECFRQCLITWDALFKRKTVDSIGNKFIYVMQIE